MVNRLARADQGAAPKLAELAAALQAAQQARHGPRLRELSAARGRLVDALTAQALAAADVPDPPPSLRLEVAQTLTAAFADPAVAAAFATGTLTRAEQWSGFGVLPADTGPDEETGAALADPAAAVRRQAEAEERLAREAAERTARHREQYEEAERMAAAAADAAAEAGLAEDRLEAEVRDLEQRLIRTRADLAAARMRARHAEAAERRARQALDRVRRD